MALEHGARNTNSGPCGRNRARDTLPQKGTECPFVQPRSTRKSAKGDEPGRGRERRKEKEEEGTRVHGERRPGAKGEEKMEKGEEKVGGKGKKATQVACGWSPAA